MSYSHQKGFGWPHALFILILIVALAGVLIPSLSFSRRGGSRTEALNNAKGIAGGLTIFKHEYGDYPCPRTRKKLEADGLKLPPGTDANSYLAQLIVTDIIDSETFFYAAGAYDFPKGDDFKNSPDNLLSSGENGFAYIMTSDGETISDLKSYSPLVIAPALSNQGIPTFDPEPYTGYYIYGAVDGSGKQGQISPEGHATSKDRSHLFETGPTSLFGDAHPVIKMPRGLKPSPESTSTSPLYYLALIPLIAFFWWVSLKSPTPPDPPQA